MISYCKNILSLYISQSCIFISISSRALGNKLWRSVFFAVLSGFKLCWSIVYGVINVRSTHKLRNHNACSLSLSGGSLAWRWVSFFQVYSRSRIYIAKGFSCISLLDMLRNQTLRIVRIIQVKAVLFLKTKLVEFFFLNISRLDLGESLLGVNASHFEWYIFEYLNFV